MKEKEPKRKFRPYLVCWNENRCIGFKTKEELNKLIETEKIDWINTEGKQIPIPIVNIDTEK